MKFQPSKEIGTLVMKPAQRLDLPDRSLAFHCTPGDRPMVVFCTGFRSDMEGGKALALEAHCRTRGQGFLRFDYRGHGQSSGRFEDGCIGEWLDDTLAVLDRLTTGPSILIGSSMGGWIVLLAALARPDRVCGLIGIAPAPDFTETLIWQRAGAEMREALARDGVWHEPSPYSETPTPITRRLLEEGRAHLLMDRPIALDCPIRLVHGERDDDVPYSTSLRLSERLVGEDVVVTLVKDGDHRLSRPRDLALITAALDHLLLRPAMDQSA